MRKRLFLSILLAFICMTYLNAQSEISYEYDNLYRLIKVTYPNGTSVSYTYDALGNRISKKVKGSTVVTYTISTSVTPSGSGSVNGAGKYNNGSSIELNAIANAGYKFSKWSDGSTANPRTINVTGNASYTAQFEESQSSLAGDVVVDGKVNVQDLNALVSAYLANTQSTKTTDIDNDSQLSIVDITKLISSIYEPCVFNNNGYQYVDLGLPSGALWATCNVGASAPEETGILFAWGETETKESYSWNNYKFTNGTKPTSTNASLTKYGVTGAYGVVDNKTILEAADDVAAVSWGGDWHMPTNEEFQELIDNTTHQWTKLNNVRGYLFTGTNGNKMFIPEGQNGCWSSSLRASGGHGTNADQLYYNSTDIEVSGGLRYEGYSVRPILSEITATPQNEVPTSYRNHDLVDLGLPSRTLWATCNLGASSPEGYGCHYAWGDTESSCDGKIFSEETYKFYSASGMTKYTAVSVLESSDDAATVVWGGAWRMPTRTEITELENESYTTAEWTMVNGVYGCRFTSIVEGYEGNSIFLPAAGYYRGSELRDAGEQGLYWGASIRDINSDSTYPSGDCIRLSEGYYSKGAANRWRGYSIRPVVSLDAINK